MCVLLKICVLGLAALHIAANNKNKRILDMLLQNGANVNAQVTNY